MDYTVLCDAITNLREGRVDPLSFLDDDDEPLMPVSRCRGQGACFVNHRRDRVGCI
jgi:hypothetical protein